MLETLLESMRDARRRTIELVGDLPEPMWEVKRLDIVNPFLWELGHVGFFYDAFILGFLDHQPPMIDGAARIYDSFKVDHDDRWDLPLPDRATTFEYIERVAAAVEARRACLGSDYCYTLATLHEDMHGEAFLYMRQALGYPAPASLREVSDQSGAWPGDVAVPGGVFSLGSDPDTTHFVFDNEKWAHPVEIAPFRIARAPVTNREYLEFVEDGGYTREECWTADGWVWRNKAGVTAPAYWRRADGRWRRAWFDREVELAPDQPVVHVGYHEAQAYCRWSGRRLPTEAEWEMAAGLDPAAGHKRRYPWGDALPADLGSYANLDGGALGCVDVAACPDGDSAVGCRQMLGNVWEWTDCAFYPFPGYVVDLPYREYSAPWFGYRKVLKGGAAATRARLVHNTYRNFFTPDRRDVFAGFRTCAR